MKSKVVLLIFIVAALTACNKDDNNENPLPVHYVSVEGVIHELNKGYLAGGMLFFVSEGLTITGLEQSTSYPIFNGIGDLVSIEAIMGQGSITSGTYDLNTIEGELTLNYDPTLTTFDYHQLLKDGTGSCIISLQNLNCEVRITGTLKDGNSVLVDFKGILTEVTN